MQFASFRIGAHLGWQDVVQNYRRSALGQFWITVSTAAMVTTLGFVFGAIFALPMRDFLPYVAVGLIVWSYLSALVQEGMAAFVSAEGLIREVPLSKLVYIIRVWWRTTLTMLHNVVVIPIVFLVVGAPITFHIVLFPFTLALTSLFFISVGAVLAFASARFRDLAPIVNSLMLVAFYGSPVFWNADSLPQRSAGVAVFLEWNPFARFLEFTRAPFIGEFPDSGDTIFCLIATVFIVASAVIVYQKFKDKIAYWV